MRTLRVLLMLILVLAPCVADQLKTDFFQLPTPEGWQISRNTTGLWQMQREMPFEMTATFLVNRLKTEPDLYLRGTIQLWKTQGVTEGTFDGRQMECLITPAEGNPIFKLVRWNQDVLVVSTFMFPVKHTDEALNTVHSLTQDLTIKNPEFEPDALRETVENALEQHQNTPEELAIAADARRQMTSFRHDWEPHFTSPAPAIFEAFLAYMEARYDAAFVVEHGEEMGMPESILESRLKSIDNRKSELQTILNNGR
jgi:hypothetical protein